MFEKLIDALVFADFVQSITKFIVRREHDWSDSVVRDISLVPDSLLAPRFLAQVANLLGCASTFDWELGTCEDGVATLEALSHDRGFVRTFQCVDASNWGVGVCECFPSPFNLVEFKGAAWVNDKDVVGGYRSIG